MIAQAASDLAEALSTQAVPELLATPQGVQQSADGLFKCIPFNGKAASWRILGLQLLLRVFFHALICKHIMQWINTPASR